MLLALRYILLLALGVVSAVACVTAFAGTGRILLAETGRQVEDPDALRFWVLLSMAGFSLLSMIRFVSHGLPLMVRTWLGNNKERLYTLLLGVILCCIFLVS